ncbi:MAG: hypothetical protein ABIX10_01620 [Acidimicrobiales bacterium]
MTTEDVAWAPRWLLPAAVVVVIAPLVAAVLAQRNAAWHPVFDLAMTEMRVRDVGGPGTPLIGLQGRIGPTGSHPGPLSFYLLAPVYRLLGSSSFALQAATGAFHGAALVTALAVVARRRDGRLVVAVAILLLLLVQGYGLGALTEPWNPHLPVLWFMAFLVAAWAVVDGDLPMLLPAVLAASLCAQTHVPYLAVTLGIGVAVAAAAGVRARTSPANGRAAGWRWLVGAAGVGVVLWVPPLIDEVSEDPGNLSQIVDELGSPSDEPIGLRTAARLVVERFDAWQLVVVETAHPGTFIRILDGPGPSLARGQASVVLWLASVGAALGLRHRRLLALHAVVAIASVVAVLAISRIYGVPWTYLMLWAFGIGALMLLSVAATAAVVLGRIAPAAGDLVRGRNLTLGGLGALALLCARLLVVAPDATTETPEQTGRLARLVPPTVAALEDEVGAASDDGGRYLLTWADAAYGGSEGIGMVNELIRRGYDVGVEERARVLFGPHHVRPPAEATARIVVASGGWADRWANEPGAVQVALDDTRTDTERAEYEHVRRAATDRLRELGREDLVDRVDTDLFGLALNEGLSTDVTRLLGRLLDIGLPVAVFVAPPEAAL